MPQLQAFDVDVLPPLATVTVEVVGDGFVAVQARRHGDDGDDVVGPLRRFEVPADGRVAVTWADLWRAGV